MSELVGARIKEARAVAGMSQKKLADAVEILSASSISKIERGLREPTEDELAAIAEALGTDVGSLLGDEGADIVSNDEEPEAEAVTDQADSDTQEAETPDVDTSQDQNDAMASLMGMLGSILGEGEGDKAEEIPAAAPESSGGDDNPLAAMLGQVAGMAGGDNPLAAMMGSADGDKAKAMSALMGMLASGATGGDNNPLSAIMSAAGGDKTKAMSALMGVLASGATGGDNNPLAALMGAAGNGGNNPLSAVMGAASGGDNTEAMAALMGIMANMKGGNGK